MKIDKIINRWSFQITEFWAIGFILILFFWKPIAFLLAGGDCSMEGTPIMFLYFGICIAYHTLGAIITSILLIKEFFNHNFRVRWQKLLNIYQNPTLRKILLILAIIEIIFFILMSRVSIKYFINNPIL